MKWHPIQGSRCAIDLSPGSGNASVSCHRLVRFCWNCREDAHSPVDCKTAAKWLLENAVPCPKCKLRIPRNQDNSLKMKCLPCNYVFCWFCHVDWIEDMEGTGGDLHFCTFDAVLSDQRGKMSESDSNRYEDCYENWDSNELLMQKEQANLPKLDTIIQELSNTQLENVSQLKFILEAGLQIIECRRVLEWTYVYGYYLREDEVGKQNLLKDTQERLKKFVENLKHCLETNLQPFRYEEEPSKDFNAFRIKLTELTRHQNDDVGRVSAVLSITDVEASTLLLHYHWSVSKVNDEWFADEERVRRTVGILEGPVVTTPDGREFTCGICFDSYTLEEIVSVSCGHPFCATCWTGYISTTINDGPGCLMLKCPDPSCPAAIGRDMIDKLASKEDKEKYYRYFLRSYVEVNREMKWCPAPGCEHAIDFAGGTESYDVSCLCSHSFCWNCTEEAHRPVDCDTVGKWILKNSAESENMNWILANSKPCPKCKRPIEKNHGCMHMTCTPPCKFEFCWLCLNAWTEHGERTGGFYACNRYEAAKQEGLYDEAERRREMAKNSLERYTHYYERWASNQVSRQKAMGDLQKMQSEKLGKLSDIQCTPESQLKFIAEAWLQIIECRRVLKWTYAYGYYLQDHAKKPFFEYLQGEAESGLERLHKCVEKDIEVFELAEGPSEEFNHFRTKLTGLTSITKTFFENLVKALENGLADVDSQAASSKPANSKPSSKTKGGGKGKGSSKNGGSSRNPDGN